MRGRDASDGSPLSLGFARQLLPIDRRQHPLAQAQRLRRDVEQERGATLWQCEVRGLLLRSLGGSLEDVVRTRVYLSDVNDWEAVARAHGRAFADIRPANTMLQVAALIGPGYRVEIEAEAMLG